MWTRPNIIPAKFGGLRNSIMPIYEYECTACGHRLEAIQRFSDAPLKRCPDCSKARLKKLISMAGFRLGGKGWYETDFQNNKQRNLSPKQGASKKDSKKDKGPTSTKSSGASASSAADS
jgi:putative FmdB family regulatory protein